VFNVLVGVLDVLIALWLLPGLLSARKKRDGKKGPWVPPAKFFFPVIFLFLILVTAGAIIMGAAEGKTSTGSAVYRESVAFNPAAGELPDLGGTFTVDRTGWYSVDYAMDSGGADVTFSLADENGRDLVDTSCSDLCNCSDSVRLKKGVNYMVRYDLKDSDSSGQVMILTSVWG